MRVKVNSGLYSYESWSVLEKYLHSLELRLAKLSSGSLDSPGAYVRPPEVGVERRALAAEGC